MNQMKKAACVLCVFGSSASIGCSSDDTTSVVQANEPAGVSASAAGTGGSSPSEPVGTALAGGAGGSAPAGSVYVLSTLLFGAEGTLGYVSVLGSLEPQVVDQDQAREFSGTADVWVHEGFVYVSNDESFTITKFSVEGNALVEQGVVSFAAYGLAGFGFWLNTFVAPNKAYYLNDTLEYIVWDPQTMQITGSIELPEPEARDVYRLFPGYSDRAAVIRDGLLYQPFYWTDDSYFQYAQDSRIAVIDVATDSVVRTLDVPCPGLDYATVDTSGNAYFSSWVYAAGGAAVLSQPSTCVVELPVAGEPRVAFDFPGVTDGRQGAAMRVLGNGRALLSVLHDERFRASKTPDASALTFADNWRFWSYDLSTGSASPVEGIDWNAGAQYSFDIDQTTYTLVADADYSATVVYDIGDGQALTPVIETRGWATRLFKVR
jgi:hypothetical protein